MSTNNPYESPGASEPQQNNLRRSWIFGIVFAVIFTITGIMLLRGLMIYSAAANELRAIEQADMQAELEASIENQRPKP